MPRKNDELAIFISDFTRRLELLIADAHLAGRETALADIRRLVGAETTPRNIARATTVIASSDRKRKADGRRNSWSNLTPQQRLDRVNRIRAGKGLPPRDKL